MADKMIEEYLKDITKGEKITDRYVAKIYIDCTKNYFRMIKEADDKYTLYIFDENVKAYNKIDKKQLQNNITNFFEENEETIKDTLIFSENKINYNYFNGKQGNIQNYYTSTTIKNKLTEEIFNMIIEKSLVEKFDTILRDVIAYKNGNLNLETFELIERTPEDLITSDVVLSYDYKDKIDKKICTEIKKMLLNAFNNDAETYKQIINIMAGFLTRNKTSRRFYNVIGDGSNGKSFLFALLKKVFEKIYVDDLSGEFLLKNASASQVSKDLAALRKPLGIYYVGELKNNDINMPLLKDFTGGEELKIQEIYKNACDVNCNGGLFILSNSPLRFKSEGESLLTRGRIIELNNIFCETQEGYERKKKELEKINSKCKVYLADKLFINNLTVEQKQMIIHILRQGFKRFYENNREISDCDMFREKFAELNALNDMFGEFIKTHFEITGNKGNKVSFDRMLFLYNDYYKLKNRYTRKELMPDLKRNNIEYNSDSSSRKGKEKGMIYGIVEHNYLDEEETQEIVNREEIEDIKKELARKNEEINELKKIIKYSSKCENVEDYISKYRQRETINIIPADKKEDIKEVKKEDKKEAKKEKKEVIKDEDYVEQDEEDSDIDIIVEDAESLDNFVDPATYETTIKKETVKKSAKETAKKTVKETVKKNTKEVNNKGLKETSEACVISFR